MVLNVSWMVIQLWRKEIGAESITHWGEKMTVFGIFSIFESMFSTKAEKLLEQGFVGVFKMFGRR